MSQVRALGRAVLAGLIAGLVTLAAPTPALAADAGSRVVQAQAPRAPQLPPVSRAAFANCAIGVSACGSPRIDRLVRAHRRRDYGAVMLVAGPPLGFAGVGLAALTFDGSRGIGRNLPWIAPLGVGAVMVVVSPFVLGAAFKGARPLVVGQDRNRGTVLLTTAFFTYVSSVAFALNANILGGGGLVIAGGLYAVGTGLLWVAANDALGKARRTAAPQLAVAPHPLRGGAGLTVAGTFGRQGRLPTYAPAMSGPRNPLR